MSTDCEPTEAEIKAAAEDVSRRKAEFIKNLPKPDALAYVNREEKCPYAISAFKGSKAADIDELRERYARQLNNPSLKKLGEWRIANSDSPHDEAAYKKRLLATAADFSEKVDEALKGI